MMGEEDSGDEWERMLAGEDAPDENEAPVDETGVEDEAKPSPAAPADASVDAAGAGDTDMVEASAGADPAPAHAPLFGDFEVSDDEEAVEWTLEDVGEEAAPEAAPGVSDVMDEPNTAGADFFEAFADVPEEEEAPKPKAPVAKAQVAKAPVSKAPLSKAPVGKAQVGKAQAAKVPVAKGPVSKAKEPGASVTGKQPPAKAPAAGKGAFAPGAKNSAAVAGKAGTSPAAKNLVAAPWRGKAPAAKVAGCGTAASVLKVPTGQPAAGKSAGGPKAQPDEDEDEWETWESSPKASASTAEVAAASRSNPSGGTGTAGGKRVSGQNAAKGVAAKGAQKGDNAQGKGGGKPADKGAQKGDNAQGKGGGKPADKQVGGKGSAGGQTNGGSPLASKGSKGSGKTGHKGGGKGGGGGSATDRTDAARTNIAEAKLRIPEDVFKELAKKSKENAEKALANIPDSESKQAKLSQIRIQNFSRLIKEHDAKGDSSGSGKRSLPATAVAPDGIPKKRLKSEEENVVYLDNQGRKFDLQHVVVNFANVGAAFAIKILHRDPDDKGKPGYLGLFDWDGVRRCLRFLRHEKGWKVTGVLNENFSGTDQSLGTRQRVSIPKDIKQLCDDDVQETPRITGANHSSADDEMTIKCAYRRNSRFLDNDNYRDWTQQLRDVQIRDWLATYQGLLHTRYYWDTATGAFDLIEGNYPAYMLAKGIQNIDKKDLWSLSRTG